MSTDVVITKLLETPFNILVFYFLFRFFNYTINDDTTSMIRKPLVIFLSISDL